MPKNIEDGQALVPYNTKVRPATKAFLDALAQAQGLRSQRVLIERMMKVYTDLYPDDTAKALEIMRVLKGGE